MSILHLDRALQRWNAAYGRADESLAIDGKTMCNAHVHQAHIIGVVGHQTKTSLSLAEGSVLCR